MSYLSSFIFPTLSRVLVVHFTMLFGNLSLGCFIVLQYMFASVLGHDSQKRLLLNDPDLVGQINQMTKNVQSLTNQVSQLTTSLSDVKSELAVQKLKSAGIYHNSIIFKLDRKKNKLIIDT